MESYQDYEKLHIDLQNMYSNEFGLVKISCK